MSGQVATLNTRHCSCSQMLTLTAPWGPQQQAQLLFLEQHRWAQFPYPEAWHQPLCLWPQVWYQPLAAPAHTHKVSGYGHKTDNWQRHTNLPETWMLAVTWPTSCMQKHSEELEQPRERSRARIPNGAEAGAEVFIYKHETKVGTQWQ